MRTFVMLIIAIVLLAPAVSAQKSKPLSDAELAPITSRGRQLEEYDAASWHATDAVLALRPPEGSVKRYIARKTDAGWVVVFGRFDDSKSAFLIVYEATQGDTPSQCKVKTNDPPAEDTGFFYVAAKAIEIALQNSELEKRPYNTYALPLQSGQIYVYVLPAQTETGIYPLGGDTRFLMSADGATIVETRRLHKAILEINRTVAKGGKKEVAGYHTHFLTDTPEDTDVFHVLRQTDPLPEYVGTRSGTYVVETDGAIVRAK